MTDSVAKNGNEGNFLDQLVDRPIADSDADILGFHEVAASLVEAITAQPNDTSLTIGLDGPWGSGKSSILEMLKSSVERQGPDDSIGLVVIHFSPWLVTNRTALVASFFAQLRAAIEAAESQVPMTWGARKKQISKALLSAKDRLNKFSSLVSIASSATATIDPTLISAATAGGSKALEKITRNSKYEKTLEAIKEELTKALSDIASADPTFRILVLIDDLDRLDPDDALEVLRLVKAVGDFPAITYLLAYDRSAIARAIEHSAKVESGDLYLEKIIQFSFKVPPLEPFQLRNWLRMEIEKLYPNQIDYSTTRASAVLDSWAGRLIDTPRDVKRLLFGLRAVYPKLEGKADLLDLIWLQLLSQKASEGERDLYSWVVRYLQAIEALAIGGRVSGEKQDREQLVSLLKALGWREYVHDDGAGSMDFHWLEELLVGVTSSYLGDDTDQKWTHKLTDANLQEFRDQKRLSSPWHWRLYFAFSQPSHAITDDEWDALVDGANKSVDQLEAGIGRILEFRADQRRDTSDQIIDRTLHAANSDSLNHPERWLVAITRKSSELEPVSKRDNIFGLSNLFEVKYQKLARNIFNKITGAQRKFAIDEIFSSANNLRASSILIREQFHASKKDGHEKEERLFLTHEELLAAIESQLHLYREIKPEELREIPSPYDILFAWRDITGSRDEPAKLLEEAITEESGMVATLESLRYLSSSAQDGVPHLPESYLENFIDTEVLRKRLEACAAGTSEHAGEADKLLKLWWSKER